MRLREQERKVYDLSHIDTQLLETLSGVGMLTASKLATLLPVPRTTISFRLHKLRKRGFCSRIKKKNLALWLLNEEVFTEPASLHEETARYRGVYELHRVLNNLAGRPIYGRVCVFEPRQQTEWFIRNVHKDLYEEINKNIQKNSIIVEALFGTGVRNLLPGLDTTTRDAMFGRMTIAYELDDAILNLKHEIIIVNDGVYFLDWEAISLTVIGSAVVANTYRTFFEFYKSLGKKIDLNAALKEAH